MTALDELAQRFWPKVWRCNHRHPCKRCCWPWAAQGIAIYNNPLQCWYRSHRKALFRDPALPRVLGAHQVAYILGKAGGTLIFPGRMFAVCHSCDFGYCCNYRHLSLGAHADNMRDKRGKHYGRDKQDCVYFPDGRCIPLKFKFPGDL